MNRRLTPAFRDAGGLSAWLLDVEIIKDTSRMGCQTKMRSVKTERSYCLGVELR